MARNDGDLRPVGCNIDPDQGFVEAPFRDPEVDAWIPEETGLEKTPAGHSDLVRHPPESDAPER